MSAAREPYPKQVAERLQISPRTALNLIRHGEIPGRKVGGQWRVSPVVLEEYLRGNVDDEPLTAGDLAAVKEAAEQFRRGEYVSLEELDR